MNYLHEFIETIDYDTLEIYSYNRGQALSDYLNGLEEERQRLLKRMEEEQDFSRQIELSKRAKQIERYQPLYDHILTSEGKIQGSASLVATIDSTHPHYQRLQDILEKPEEEAIASRCIEEFRDGILFKQGDKIVDALSICFHCATIRTNDNRRELFTDLAFYQHYRALLAEIGHDVGER